jgi:putative transposase
MALIDSFEEGRLVRLFQYKNRLISENEIYHITQRAPGNELLFLEEGDFLYFLHLLKETTRDYSLELFSFVLMPNHIHLLLRILKDNLSDAMRHLFQRYALHFNSKYQRKGHVFSGRFRSALCRGDTYLLAISLYIHLNPVKARLCHNPEDYRFSSVLPYIKDIKKKTFIKSEFVLKLVNEDINKARRTYENILEDALAIKYKNLFVDKTWLETFIHGLTKIFSEENISLPLPIDITELENKIKNLINKKRLRDPQTLKARKYLIEQLMARGYLVTEIAEKLNISRQSIYKTLGA